MGYCTKRVLYNDDTPFGTDDLGVGDDRTKKMHFLNQGCYDGKFLIFYKDIFGNDYMSISKVWRNVDNISKSRTHTRGSDGFNEVVGRDINEIEKMHNSYKSGELKTRENENV